MSETMGIQCQCGTVKGVISDKALQRHNHLICYCKDCQAFARYVAKEDTMNNKGGTEIVQVSCADVSITEGIDSIACIRLNEGTLVRWYAKCCNTPLANAPGPGLPFIGLIHTCLQPVTQINNKFGPISLVAFANGAASNEKPKSIGMPMGMIRFVILALGAKFRGDGKRHPLFNANGEPIVTPKVLSDAERAPLYLDEIAT